MPQDPTKPQGFDPQPPQPGGSTQQQSQQGSQQEDEELSQFLQDQHGHTKQAADAEVKRDREGVKRKKKEHEEKHGGSSSRGR